MAAFLEVVSAAMPTYDYRCQSCGSRFEVWQKITDEPIETCPTCGGPVRRIVHPVGLVFKGSGFYKTDHRDSSGAIVASGDSSSNGAAANASTSTESKTETKSVEAKTTESKTTESKTTAEPAATTTSTKSTATASAGE